LLTALDHPERILSAIADQGAIADRGLTGKG
jgi:hypothetical protein